MKNYFLFFMIITASTCFAQKNVSTEKAEIQLIVDQFFVALEKQDTALFNTMLYKNAQVWVVQNKGGKLKNTVSTFGADFWSLNPKFIIRERALDIDITIHKDIAIAWVPYEVFVNDKLAHCGIDTFTFLKSQEGWKIVNCSYSMEPDGCEAIKANLEK